MSHDYHMTLTLYHVTTLQLPDLPSLVASLSDPHDDITTHAKIGLPSVIADPDPTATRYYIINFVNCPLHHW